MSEPKTAPSDSDIEALLDAAAKLHGLEIRPDWRAPCIMNLKVTAEAARLVEAFPLEDETEPAFVFVP